MKVTWDKQYFMQHTRSLPAFKEVDMKDVLDDAGCIKYYYDPQIDTTVFEVKKIPHNKLLLGLKWIEVTE